jgi:hypothetical protein
MEKIYVIGDSHSVFWSGANGLKGKEFINGIHIVPEEEHINKFFTVFHLGSCLAYTMNKTGSSTRGRDKADFLINNNFIPKKSTIMTCFGEVDIRSHFLKKGESQVKTRLHGAIKNYIEYIDYLLSAGYDPIIYGPVATQKDHYKMNKNWPRYGTELERNCLTKEFNEILSDKCKERNIMFISLFEDMVNDSLETKEDFICDQCHLGVNVYDFALLKFMSLYVAHKTKNKATEIDQNAPMPCDDTVQDRRGP